MKLFTKKILKDMPRIGDTAELEAEEVTVRCKLFGGSSASWYITEYNPEEDKAFGMVNLGNGHYPELGYIEIGELKEMEKVYPLFFLERDIGFKPMKLSELKEKLNRGEHV